MHQSTLEQKFAPNNYLPNCFDQEIAKRPLIVVLQSYQHYSSTIQKYVEVSKAPNNKKKKHTQNLASENTSRPHMLLHTRLHISSPKIKQLRKKFKKKIKEKISASRVAVTQGIRKNGRFIQLLIIW